MATPVLLPHAAPAPIEGGPVLGGLLPGIKRGTAVSVAGDAGLLLALATGAGPERDGWCAAVGLPELGLLAATGYGIDPGRLLLADRPGRQWPEVVAALAGGVEVVLLRPPGEVAPQLAARLGAVLRRTGCVLLVAGDWPGAALRLSVRRSRWVGLGAGHGLLAGRQAEVLVEGRGAAARGRSGWLWLPDEHGVVRALTPAEQAEADGTRGGALAPAAVGVGSGGQPSGDAVGRGRLTAV
ncbi:hypothetical protein C7C46_21820 [Streptomyces tateyamensis]|uniref:Recombinase A n=1 Tax=Streptomyces tateyamensis TaxID=565073 RepID=A0A2V4MZF9_9ACTN|nr:hypothetical protein [Streptomyces tateyamensis]PYC76819.1 hypothetical protein C7C46_21820 [Streptomyces tateyamensis]